VVKKRSKISDISRQKYQILMIFDQKHREFLFLFIFVARQKGTK